MSSTPSLSPSSAFWLSGTVASSYVVSVYISQLVAPPRPPLWRNEPSVIKARLLCASISTILCCVVVGWVVKRTMSLEGDDVSSRLFFQSGRVLILYIRPSRVKLHGGHLCRFSGFQTRFRQNCPRQHSSTSPLRLSSFLALSMLDFYRRRCLSRVIGTTRKTW